jgi:hypothetical protein
MASTQGSRENGGPISDYSAWGNHHLDATVDDSKELTTLAISRNNHYNAAPDLPTSISQWTPVIPVTFNLPDLLCTSMNMLEVAFSVILVSLAVFNGFGFVSCPLSTTVCCMYFVYIVYI